jgi:hypothetical protein
MEIREKGLKRAAKVARSVVRADPAAAEARQWFERCSACPGLARTATIAGFSPLL